MAFTKDFRSHFPTRLQTRFKCYWHAMHPRTFASRELYKAAFSDEEWAALNVLRKRRSDCIDAGHYWRYKLDLSQMLDRPEYVPKEPCLTFQCKKGWPDITVNETDFSVDIQEKMRDWTLVAYQYNNDSDVLGQKLRELLRLEFQHYDTNRDYSQRRVERALVNTPGTLFRIWPELLPFMEAEERDTLRNKKMKSPLPKEWDAGDHAKFLYGPAMERVTYALTVMSLIPEERDKKYPSLT